MTGGMADLPTGRQIVTQALLDEGAAPGGSIHSWRCEHPDRYGPCACVEQAAAVVVDRLVGAGFVDGRALLDDLRGLVRRWKDEPGLDFAADDASSLLARYALPDPTPKEQP